MAFTLLVLNDRHCIHSRAAAAFDIKCRRCSRSCLCNLVLLVLVLLICSSCCLSIEERAMAVAYAVAVAADEWLRWRIANLRLGRELLIFHDKLLVGLLGSDGGRSLL